MGRRKRRPPVHRLCAAAEAGLAEAGDVGFAPGGSHDALSGAARNVVVDLGTWKVKEKREAGHRMPRGTAAADGRPLPLTRQAEAGLVQVAHWLLGNLLLLLLLPGGGSLHGGDGVHRFRSHSHLAHRPVVLPPGDPSQLCELDTIN